VHKLPARGVAEQSTVLPGHDALRAHNYVQSGHAAAAALQTSCAWAVIDVPGVGHEGRLMSAAAAPIVSAAMHAS